MELRVNSQVVHTCVPQREAIATETQTTDDCKRIMTTPTIVFDKALLKVRRNRAKATIKSVDYLLVHVAQDFIERLSLIQRTFPRALNLGAHHGLITEHLRGKAGIAEIIDMDDAEDLVALCSGKQVVASEEQLPFGTECFDLIFSGLKLHYLNDLPGTLIQARQALKPDGLFLAALLGGVTLRELRQAFLAAEGELTGGASPRVAPFLDVREAGALLQRAGFALPVTDSDILTVTYPSMLHLIHELRAMGATNALAERSRRPLRRQTLARAAEFYAENYSEPNGHIRATFEIITMTGWAPHESQPKPLRPGSAKTSLASVLPPSGKPRSSGR